MKKFIIHICLILICSIAILYGLDRVITHNLHHSTATMYRCWNELIYGQTNYNLIINGNSRAWKMYSPAILDSALHTNSYNIGLDGRGIDTQSLRFYTYCAHHKAPTYLIQNVEAFTLEPSNGYEREQFLPYFSEPLVWNYAYQYEDMHILERCIPLIRYSGYRDVIYEGLGLKHNNMLHESTIKGYRGEKRMWDGKVFSKLDKWHFCYDSLRVAMLDDELAFCRQNDIQVVMVFAPVYVGAVEKMSEADYNLMMQVYNGLSEKYGVPFLNFLDDDLCQDTAYFYNATHMNLLGAELFSLQLADSLKSIIK